MNYSIPPLLNLSQALLAPLTLKRPRSRLPGARLRTTWVSSSSHPTLPMTLLSALPSASRRLPSTFATPPMVSQESVSSLMPSSRSSPAPKAYSLAHSIPRVTAYPKQPTRDRLEAMVSMASLTLTSTLWMVSDPQFDLLEPKLTNQRLLNSSQVNGVSISTSSFNGVFTFSFISWGIIG